MKLTYLAQRLRAKRRSRTQAISSFPAQALERKALLDAPVYGNVQLAYGDSSLDFRGDDDRNDVNAYVDTSSWELVVEGQNGTTINHLPEVRVGLSELGDVRYIRAWLGDGDDNLWIDGTGLSSSDSIGAGPMNGWFDLGGGNDGFSLYGVEFSNRVSVWGGDGDDNIYVGQAAIGGNFYAYGGNGNDAISMYETWVGGSAVLKGQRGDNWIDVTMTEVQWDLRIQGGKHNTGAHIADSWIGDDVNFKSWGGYDGLAVETTFIGRNLSYNSGGGSDFFVINSSYVLGKSIIDSGKGDDFVAISNADPNGGYGGYGGYGMPALPSDIQNAINGSPRSNMFGDDVRVFNRGGNDALKIYGVHYFGDALKLKGGKGWDVAAITPGQIIQGDYYFKKYEVLVESLPEMDLGMTEWVGMMDRIDGANFHFGLFLGLACPPVILPF